MPENARYSMLHQESKHFNNIIKMICYRAETALVRLIAPHYKRAEDEARILVKSIMRETVDIEPYEKNKLLMITIYPLSENRGNRALNEVVKKK